MNVECTSCRAGNNNDVMQQVVGRRSAAIDRTASGEPRAAGCASISYFRGRRCGVRMIVAWPSDNNHLLAPRRAAASERSQFGAIVRPERFPSGTTFYYQSATSNRTICLLRRVEEKIFGRSLTLLPGSAIIERACNRRCYWLCNIADVASTSQPTGFRI